MKPALGRQLERTRLARDTAIALPALRSRGDHAFFSLVPIKYAPPTCYKHHRIPLRSRPGRLYGNSCSWTTTVHELRSWYTERVDQIRNQALRGRSIGYYTWWWFIDDLEHRPGKYEWQLFVNGSPITRIQSAD